MGQTAQTGLPAGVRRRTDPGLPPHPTAEVQDAQSRQGHWERWAIACVVVGLLARITRYALRFPLWEDESFLCANLIDRSFGELTGVLDYHQVAPVAFLMLQKAVVSMAGFHEFSLRLIPFVAGIASLLLFWRLAARLCTGLPYVLAVAIFAASYPLVRYSAEAKPYGCDVLASLALVLCVVEWLKQPTQTRWLWLLAGVAPIAIAFSYASVFVAGGVSLAILLGGLGLRNSPAAVGETPACETPGWASIAWPWLAFNAGVAATFLVVLATAANQADGSLEWMQRCWQSSFPPLAEPWKIPGWLLDAHTGELLAYPTGSRTGGSFLTCLACVIGVGALVRARQWPLVALACGPLALNLLAAALERYPYGGQTRLSLYHAPWFCLLAGLGLAAGLTWLNRWRLLAGQHELRVRMVLSVLLLFAVGIMARDVALPFKTRSDQRARDFARWFWFETQNSCETVCLRTDLGQELHPEAPSELSWMSMYLCNQRIYSPRHAAGKPPAWEQISDQRPLWCLDFVPATLARDTQAEAVWLVKMQQRYELLDELQFPFVRYDKQEKFVVSPDYVKVWRFRPRRTETVARETPAAQTLAPQ